MKVSIHTQPLGGTDFDASRKPIDWASASDRKWLQNHLHWAMHNAQVVTIQPLRVESN